MANPEHLAKLKEGVETWNAWRAENPGVRVDLIEADLVLATLAGAILTEADLSRAKLTGAKLTGAYLEGAYLNGADLRGANLTGADLTKANLTDADLRGADLTGADLTGADLTRADLTRADLTRADLTRADLTRANLYLARLLYTSLQQVIGLDHKWKLVRKIVSKRAKNEGLSKADLAGANLEGVDLPKANLEGANLRGASLRRANLIGANLCRANLEGADLRQAMLADAGGNAANLTGAILTGARLKQKGEGDAATGFLELATATGLGTVDFGKAAFLSEYLADAFTYAHRPDLAEAREFPQFIEKSFQNIKLLRSLLETQDEPPPELVEVVRTITAELLTYLKRHPKALYQIKPRQFEELIAEILASFGWQVQLTPASKDGGYDLFAISTDDRAGVKTSWLIECKKYSAENKVGVDIVRALYGSNLLIGAANLMLATTSYFTKGVRDFKASRYDLELKDYEGVLEWINAYRPHSDGRLYVKDNRLVLPGREGA